MEGNTNQSLFCQLFSFVPAKKAKIGLVDKILSRIKTSETLAQDQSAFAADLKQVKIICESCTDKSLILIDEFGKGNQRLIYRVFIFLV